MGVEEPHEAWPALPFAAWKETLATLHRWMQVVGKVRLARTPWINHSWHVTLYLSARGLTTSLIQHGRRSFALEFDFVEHRLLLRSSLGDVRAIALQPMAVADFYAQVMAALREMNLAVQISTTPNELEDATPFPEDRVHAAYDPEYVHRFWRVLLQADRVFKVFRSSFIGKCSPVHFFWGSFDLAVTRFSGRTAPPHPGGVPHLPLRIAQEAYSHEVSSLGFWPGSEAMPEPIFYSYAYPMPDGFAEAEVQPRAASWNVTFREFVLPYDAVRTASAPDEVLLTFARSTYEVAANLGKWDRDALEH
ncbi:MAG: DUF5996 family protein, partial [Verrucomicrobiaceae bacterium]|nr:DUF5996 family protein [Verrucomicrobiaceae bacterium]